jgi:peptidyl-prolyl cis-trans isomerase A (cyclophilin A)
MRLRRLAALVLTALFLWPLDGTGQTEGPTLVTITTGLGDIEISVDTVRAPNTAANFLRYVTGRHYNGGAFFRSVTLDNQPNNEVKIEVIQARVNLERIEDRFEAIQLERTDATGIYHIDGAISMARGAPNSATSSFFICIGNQPSLDFGGARNPDGQGFAAFGRVTRGQEVVKLIQQQSTSGQQLEPPIQIDSATVTGQE